MTIREKLLALLEENGLSADEALVVLAYYVESDSGEPMNRRLDDSLESYPPAVLVAAWIDVRATAVEWIDENKPLHWARAMFIG